MLFAARLPTIVGLLFGIILSLAASPHVAWAQASADSTRLELPHEPSKPSKWHRISLTWAGSVLGTGLAAGAAYFAGHAAGKDCERQADEFEESWCGLDAVATGSLVALIAVPTLSTLGSALPHRALQGRGRWWTGFLGSLLGMGVGFGGVAITVAATESDPAINTALVLGAVATATLPVVFLELDHAHRDKRYARSNSHMAAAAAPVPGGMVLGLSGRL